MRRLALATVLLAACSETGLTVDVSARSDVPALDALRIQVTQGSLLVAQTFPLGGKALPQSIAIVSKGMTRGSVDVVVQGLSNGTVEATGTASGELQSANSGVHLAVTLARFCPGSGICGCTPRDCATDGGSCGELNDTCGGERACGTCSAADVCTNNVCVPASCTKKTCAGLGAQCGQVLDGCDGVLDCGTCDAGTCGANDQPNHCGLGPCVPRTTCDAGMTCGQISDGCSAMLSCGTCDAGSCGGGGTPFQCGCTPLTACPAGQDCGTWPDGCGHMLDCGACDAGTCGGGGTMNQCGCTPLTACPSGACDHWPNGCGGSLACSELCTQGNTCQPILDGGDGDSCQCPEGTTSCSGTCSDLSTDSANCGTCGNACFGGQQCSSGMCPCVDAGSNLDGHCCPSGWFMGFHVGQTFNERCFNGPQAPSPEVPALDLCKLLVLQGYGRAASALGVGGQETDEAFAVPANACGSFLYGPTNPTRIVVAQATTTSSVGCDNACAVNCECMTCPCTNVQTGCSQPYFCVMDPLGPRVEGPCAIAADCPAGMTCTAGACVSSGRPFCSVDSDCLDAGYNNCMSRGGSMTGLCN